jgi:hypothetical protein
MWRGPTSGKNGEVSSNMCFGGLTTLGRGRQGGATCVSENYPEEVSLGLSRIKRSEEDGNLNYEYTTRHI